MRQDGEEAVTDVEHIRRMLDRYWCAVKTDTPDGVFAEQIEAAALHAAAECIQVAAMAHKATRGYRGVIARFTSGDHADEQAD